MNPLKQIEYGCYMGGIMLMTGGAYLIIDNATLEKPNHVVLYEEYKPRLDSLNKLNLRELSDKEIANNNNLREMVRHLEKDRSVTQYYSRKNNMVTNIGAGCALIGSGVYFGCVGLNVRKKRKEGQK